MRRELRFAVAGLLCAAGFAHADYLDTYTTDTSANYTQTDADPGHGTFAVNTTAGQLQYTGQTSGYQTSTYFLKSSQATVPTANGSIFTTSGDLLATGDQPGLIVSGSLAAGGFTVQRDNAIGGNAFALLQETGGQLGGDEGGGGNPPVLANLGTPNDLHNYHIAVTETISTGHPVFHVVIDDTTTATNFFTGDVTDTNVNGFYGGNQIGFRVRPPESTTNVFDNLALTVTAVPEPASLSLLGLAGLGLLARRQRA